MDMEALNNLGITNVIYNFPLTKNFGFGKSCINQYQSLKYHSTFCFEFFASYFFNNCQLIPTPGVQISGNSDIHAFQTCPRKARSFQKTLLRFSSFYNLPHNPVIQCHLLFFCQKIVYTGMFVHKMNFLLFYELQQLTISCKLVVHNHRHVTVCIPDAIKLTKIDHSVRLRKLGCRKTKINLRLK